MSLICAVVPQLLLAGCSSFRGDPENVKAVPEDRLLGYQEALGKAGQLVVNRDFGGMGAGCYVAILVDRTVAARIGMGEGRKFVVVRMMSSDTRRRGVGMRGCWAAGAPDG